VTRRFPNGATQRSENCAIPHLAGGQPGELKHLMYPEEKKAPLVLRTRIFNDQFSIFKDLSFKRKLKSIIDFPPLSTKFGLSEMTFLKIGF